MSSITNQTAHTIIDKMAASQCLLAVFVKNGCAKITKITTGFFSDALEKTPGRLIGVYSQECPIEWLIEDLEYMGVK